MSGIVAQNVGGRSGLIKSVAAGGEWTLIQTQTASSSATLDFTSGLDSTYDEYCFKFININPSTDSNLTFQGSTDGGSSYGVTATTTFFYASHDEADSEAVLSYYASRDLAQGTGFQYLTGDNIEPDGSGSTAVGYLHLFGPSSTTFVKHFNATTNHVAAGPYQQNNYSAGYFNTTSAIDAVQFKMTSETIEAGTISLYGIG